MAPTDMLVMPKKTAGITSEAFARLRDEIGIEEESAPASSATQSHCPFCGEPLPDAPSESLTKMMAHWKSKKDAGRLIRATDTLAVCQRHRDERDVIPNGAKRGWPLQLNLAALRKRVSEPSGRYLRVLEDRVRDPESSEWFRYGERGWELFRDIVHAAFLGDPLTPTLDLRQAGALQRILPLDAHSFTELVLIPELACMLVQDDMGGATYEEAQSILRESSKFGIAVHGSDSAPGAASHSGWLGKRAAPSPPVRKSARLHQPRISTFFGAHQ